MQIDKSKCIGCQFCAMACPYGVRYLERGGARRGEVHALRADHRPGRPASVRHPVRRPRPLLRRSWSEGIDSFEAPEIGYDVDRSYDNLYTGNRVTLGELAEEYADADVHHLPDVGNGPHFAYILRDREWKGGE